VTVYVIFHEVFLNSETNASTEFRPLYLRVTSRMLSDDGYPCMV